MFAVNEWCDGYYFNASGIYTEAYQINYNANGGSPTPAMQTKFPNTNLTLTNTTPTKTNYKIAGWSTSSSATEPTYFKYGSSYTYTANAGATLYAVWGKNGDVNLNNAVNIEDINIVNALIMGKTPAKNYHWVTGDVNRDGVINIADINMITSIIYS